MPVLDAVVAAAAESHLLYHLPLRAPCCQVFWIDPAHHLLAHEATLDRAPVEQDRNQLVFASSAR